MLLPQLAQSLPVCHAAGGWLSHTKPNRETVSFPDMFKDQENTWLEAQDFSQGLASNEIGRGKTKATSKCIQQTAIA